MSGSARQQETVATAYTVAGSFLGAAAGGGWLGLVLLSLAGLYGNAALWEDLLSAVIAGGAVAGLAYLCARAVEPHGRLSGMLVVLVALLTALNVSVALYLFGGWVCVLPPAGPAPAFTDCRIPVLASPDGVSPLTGILLLYPAILAAILGAAVTIRNLLTR